MNFINLVSSFKWFQKHAKCDSKGAKLSGYFYRKFTEIVLRLKAPPLKPHNLRRLGTTPPDSLFIKYLWSNKRNALHFFRILKVNILEFGDVQLVEPGISIKHVRATASYHLNRLCQTFDSKCKQHVLFLTILQFSKLKKSLNFEVNYNIVMISNRK